MKILKSITALVVYILLFSVTLYAGEFKKVWDYNQFPTKPTEIGTNSPSKFKQLNGWTHFISGEPYPYTVLNNYNTKQEYTKNSTGYPVETVGDYLQALSSYPATDMILSNKGLLYMNVNDGPPIFTKFINKTELPGFTESGASNLTGFSSTYIGGYTTHFYTTNKSLFKLKADMTEVIASYDYPIATIKNQESINILTGRDTLWTIMLPFQYYLGFCEFDVINEQWKVYDSTNLPIIWYTKQYDIDEVNNNNTKFAYKPVRAFFDWDAASPKPILAISATYKNSMDVTNIHSDNALLYFNRITRQYDTVRLNLDNFAEYFGNHPNVFTILNAFPIYNSSNKIVITFVNTYSQKLGAAGPSNRYPYFMLFDWNTKTFEILDIPDSLFYRPEWKENYHLQYAGAYTDIEGNECIGLLYTSGDFFSYNLTTSITEEGNIPDLWFRRVYPNPANHRVTAEIMCYVSDRTKLDIGLYDLMGRKLLDLSNNFDYSDATHTIYTTFNVPENISNGVYYLRVRNGTENRTQALVIGYK